MSTGPSLACLERASHANFTSRRATGGRRLGCSTSRKASVVIVCMGRNDGASGSKRRSSNRGSQRPKGVAGPAVDDGLWYERDPDSIPSTSGSVTNGRGRPQPSTSGSAWDRAGSLSNRSSGRQGRRSKGSDDDDEEDTRGWWERPEERSLQAYAAPDLEPWQEERLQLAYASGRRKAQIQDLARELDLDRSVVLAWFKEFSLRPQKERDAIIAARLGEEEARRAEQASRDAVEAATGQGRNSARIAAAAKPGQESPSGFIPFYLRKQLGVDKQKRISGEVLRTLESIYDRTPFPSADVVRGLYELHRLPRDVASEWFAARREADGITSSTQKRTGRASLREKDRNIEAAFSGSDGGPSSAPPGAAAGGPPGPGPESGSLLSQLGAVAGSAKQPPEPTVVTLSRREMAALRSSLPSPNKHKGRQMAEKMGVKTGPDTNTTQIGNVQYVEDAPPQAAAMGERVRASWRYRAAEAAGAGPRDGAGRRLRLRTRSAGRSSAGDQGEGGADE